jgi:hypothetical protein
MGNLPSGKASRPQPPLSQSLLPLTEETVNIKNASAQALTSWIPSLFTPSPSPSSSEISKKSLKPISPDGFTPPPPPEQTIFYLAYGSNLCAQTFLVQRGIKPISVTKVLVPDLILTFDIPGIAYLEPCFANAQFKSSSTKSTLPSSPSFSEANTTETEASPLLDSASRENHGDIKPGWKPSDGMIGVVYEISQKDFATIIATEGAGLCYKVAQVITHPIDDGDSDGDNDEIVISAQKLTAHTLIAPPGNRAKPGRPIQPSQRYLNLVRKGALEHNLPIQYLQYLEGLESYSITQRRQRMGAAFFDTMWVPLFLIALNICKLTARNDGHAPNLVVKFFSGMVFLMWANYDWIWIWVFGDGERTVQGR